MNHALICKNYYKSDKNTLDFYKPELIKFRLYFNSVHARDWYYNAMKYHAIHIIKELVPNITLKEIGDIVNLSHCTVIHYFKNYTPLDGHKEFISNNFDKFVENGIYPLKPKNHKDIKQYGAFKPTSLEEARKRAGEQTKKKDSNEEQYKIHPAKNPTEKY